MYTFDDGRRGLVTLRPEATASVVRSYIQHKMFAEDPVRKFYTIGPMFRRERPQKGRYRQFYQIDAEVFGIASPLIDAQIIFMLVSLFERLEVTDVSAHINCLGCPACRPDFQKALFTLLEAKKGELCENCVRRSGKNPLRTLDCKVPACREALAEAPSILDYLCDDCKSHFDTVKQQLDKQNVRYEVDRHLVRGLDYYTRTAFEILTNSLGAQNAVAGGGRYDGLVEALSGPPVPAIGFAIGFDRLAEILSLTRTAAVKRPKIYLAPLGEPCRTMAFEWSCALNLSGVPTEMDFEDRNLKNHMKRADRFHAAYALIFGENELVNGHAVLRNMETREQKEIPLVNLVTHIINLIR
jgi:histidyl-tRNA synthetase